MNIKKVIFSKDELVKEEYVFYVSNDMTFWLSLYQKATRQSIKHRTWKILYNYEGNRINSSSVNKESVTVPETILVDVRNEIASKIQYNPRRAGDNS